MWLVAAQTARIIEHWLLSQKILLDHVGLDDYILFSDSGC